VFLAEMPSAYRPGALDRWSADVIAHPVAASASAIAFTVGLAALVLWALALRERLNARGARAGALAIAVGALLNAAGTMTPLVLALYVEDAGGPAIGRALLGLTLSLDACFNLALGVGLIAVASDVRAQGSRWLGALAMIAGIASLPVSAQAFSDGAAKLLVLSAPLWLAFIVVASTRRWVAR
jgi:hypothetical protein